MNKEELKKNFILLSKVAKEKRYAQEYLGLLARRGDLGSIRIGKRWYTTTEWFSEFISDAETRKAEVKVAEKNSPIVSEKIAAEIEAIPVLKTIPKRAKEIEKIEIAMPMLKPKRKTEKVGVRRIAAVGQPRVIKFPTIDLRKIAAAKIEKEKIIFDPAPVRREFARPEKMIREKQVIKKIEDSSERMNTWNRADVFSPAFSPDEKEKISFFPKLAFGFSFVLLFILLFQVAFTYKNDIMKLTGIEKGTVAGASDEKGSNLQSMRLTADTFMMKADNAVRENLSFSRLVVNVAKGKNNQ